MWDMLWVSGDERGDGRLVNEIERVGEGGGGMLISVVDALTCNMDLIA